MASLLVPPISQTKLYSFKHPNSRSNSHFGTKHYITLKDKYYHNNNKNGSEETQNLHRSYYLRISSLCKEGEIQEAVDLLAEMGLKDLHVGTDIYGELLQGCVYERDLLLGQQLHAQIIKRGDLFARNDFVETKLVIFYAKCDASEVANRLFRGLQAQNVFAWAAIIGLQCRMGFCEEALLGFCQMQENGFLPDNFVVPNALKACGALMWVRFGKVIHGFVIKMMGFGGCVFVASSLIDMYGKCGDSESAGKVFDGMPEKNVVAWNSVIVSYVQNGLNEKAINVFYDMREEGVEPTQVTLLAFLSASANLGAFHEGRQGHALAVLAGFELDHILGSSIINFYSKIGLLEEAELVFSRMVMKDAVTWNLLISSYVQFGRVERALYVCHLMREENLRFDSVTLSSLFKAASDSRNLELGKEAHCYCIRNNLESDVVVSSGIVHMYAKCEKIDCARTVFNSAQNRDLVLWNTILAAYAELGLSGETLRLFYKMQLESILPNVVSWNSVVFGFLRNGQVNEAQDMFSQMCSHGVSPNLVTWTTLISGLAQNGFGYKAISVFQKMQEAGVKPDTISLTFALSACSDTALLQYGKALHCYVIRHNIDVSVHVMTSLLDMYSKCGLVDDTRWVFTMCSRKELPVYNAMISAYASHGQATEALEIFKQMEKQGIEPDSISFTSVLSAFSRCGLVKDGLEFFNYMVSKLRVRPSMEHYGCLIHLLSRCGNLDEAIKVIFTMPSHPDAHILGSLLMACLKHPETQLGENISKWLLQAEPDNPGNYVALSNAYATARRWDKVSNVRSMMKQKGLKKIPGCSWIEVGQELNVFVAGDRSHPKIEEIYKALDMLGKEIRSTMIYQL